MLWLPNRATDHIISVSAQQLLENFLIFPQVVYFNVKEDLVKILFLASGLQKERLEVMH